MSGTFTVARNTTTLADSSPVGGCPAVDGPPDLEQLVDPAHHFGGDRDFDSTAMSTMRLGCATSTPPSAEIHPSCSSH